MIGSPHVGRENDAPSFIVALAALFVLLAGAPAAATIATPAGWPPDVVDCVDAPGPSSS